MNANPAWGQASEILTLIGEHSPTRAEITQAIVAFDDVLLAIKSGTLPPREQFRKLCKLPELVVPEKAASTREPTPVWGSTMD